MRYAAAEVLISTVKYDSLEKQRKICIWKTRESGFFQLEIVCKEEITSAGNGTDSGLGVSAMKAYRKGGGITPVILNLDCTWRCVVSLTPRPLIPEERVPVTNSVGG